MQNELLLSITFVFGVIYLFSIILAAVTSKNITGFHNSPLAAFLHLDQWRKESILRELIIILSNYMFHLSLMHQAWYWLFK